MSRKLQLMGNLMKKSLITECLVEVNDLRSTRDPRIKRKSVTTGRKMSLLIQQRGKGLRIKPAGFASQDPDNFFSDATNLS